MARWEACVNEIEEPFQGHKRLVEVAPVDGFSPVQAFTFAVKVDMRLPPYLCAIRVRVMKGIIHSDQANITVSCSEVEPNLKRVSLHREKKLNRLLFNCDEYFVLALVYLPNEAFLLNCFLQENNKTVSLSLS